MAEQDTPQDQGAPRKDENPPAGGPRHALPEDMQPAEAPAEPSEEAPAEPSADATGTGAAGTAGQQPAGPARTAPAYESYEAPESNLMPITIAAIVGGLCAALLLLRLLRGADPADE